MAEILKRADALVWGPGMLVFLLGSGLFLLVRMRFLPLRNLRYALRCVRGSAAGSGRRGEISPASSLATELAATIGTGNIVGVATAMVLGGPGALPWMILAAFAGLSTKFAESMLSVTYRTKDETGRFVGGPMYTLRRAFPFPRLGNALGSLFAAFAVLASFGMGNMTQSNSIAASFRETFGVSEAKTGLIVTILVILTVLGGIRSISRLSLYLVPAMALFYILGAGMVILMHLPQLPGGIVQMIRMAFSAQAVAGGVGGSILVSMQDAMRWGVSRGVFSNEAGLGAGGITAAAADTDSPVRQAYISMTGVFFDTIVICSLTGLALAASGVLGMQDENGELLTGAALTIAAFSTVFGKLGGCFVSMAIAFFAFATIIAWEYQGECAFGFLVKKKRYCLCYRFFYGLLTFAGAVCTLEAVWDFSDIMNGLMVIPNLLGVLALSGTVCREMNQYERVRRGRDKNCANWIKECMFLRGRHKK